MLLTNSFVDQGLGSGWWLVRVTPKKGKYLKTVWLEDPPQLCATETRMCYDDNDSSQHIRGGAGERDNAINPRQK